MDSAEHETFLMAASVTVAEFVPLISGSTQHFDWQQFWETMFYVIKVAAAC